MKKIVLVLLGILTLACSSGDDVGQINNLENISSLKYTVKQKNEPSNLIHSKEYIFDEQGKVVSEDYISFSNPQHNYFSTFEYDDKGRIVKEIRDGELHSKIVWTNDFAEVYNNQDQKISEFDFSGDLLMEYKVYMNTNPRTRKFNYDFNQNIISIGNESEVFVEFLDYDTSKRNPLNLIKSIGILRIDSKPFFKNIFEVEKAYPYEGDDYSFSLKFYNYHYTFDSEDRVYQIEDDKTLIYTREFNYVE